MTYTQANKLLKKFLKKGYHAHHTGIVIETLTAHKNDKIRYGINIDGRGTMDDPTGCPRIYWNYEHGLEMLNHYNYDPFNLGKE